MQGKLKNFVVQTLTGKKNMSDDDNDLGDPFIDKSEEDEELADDSLVDDDLEEPDVDEDEEEDDADLLWNPDEE